jgi:hypothetical protein
MLKEGSQLWKLTTIFSFWYSVETCTLYLSTASYKLSAFSCWLFRHKHKQMRMTGTWKMLYVPRYMSTSHITVSLISVCIWSTVQNGTSATRCITLHNILCLATRMQDKITIYWLLIHSLNFVKIKRFGTTATNQNCIHEEIKNRLNTGSVCY